VPELGIRQDLGTFRSFLYSAMVESEIEIYFGLLRAPQKTPFKVNKMSRFVIEQLCGQIRVI
jgi:hypothetical protein